MPSLVQQQQKTSSREQTQQEVLPDQTISRSNMDVQEDMQQVRSDTGGILSTCLSESSELDGPSLGPGIFAPVTPYSILFDNDDRSHYALGTELLGDKGLDENGERDERLLRDQQAHTLGLDVEASGYFQPTTDEDGRFQSADHERIDKNLQSRSTDEVYQKRLFQSDKTYERNAKFEHHKTLDQKTPKAWGSCASSPSDRRRPSTITASASRPSRP